MGVSRRMLVPMLHVLQFLLVAVVVAAAETLTDNTTAPLNAFPGTHEGVRSAGSVNGTGVKPGRIYLMAQFVTPHSNGSFRHLAVSEETHGVFVGAVDYIYGLDKDLNMKVEAKTGPVLDSGKCPPPVDDNRTCPSQHYTNNVNKVLVIDEVDDKLITCGTIYHGYCERRDLSDVSRMERPDFRTSVVSNNASASVVAFIGLGPSSETVVEQQRVLYVSVSWSKPEGILEDIPALSSRKLKDFTLAFKDSLKFTSTSFNFEGTQRPQFLVKYIYGFSSENYSYILTVQRTKPGAGNVPHQSVAVRVCQKDMNYYSYIEVPLVCTFGGSNDLNSYPILVAAYVTKPGRNLALLLGINTKTDVLFAIFARVDAYPSEENGEALCLFRMDVVRSKFTENIMRCFDGHGSSGGGHLGSAKACTKNLFKISENYCGETDSNQPIAGTEPIVSQPVLTFPQSTTRLSSIIVTTTHDYTVAFVGTSDGQIMKVSVESNASTNIYETVFLVPGSAIEADMSFDDNKDNLYVLTDKKVVKMRVHNCSQYLTCSSCLSARDPYCGWCSVESKCSERKDCQESDLSKRWLPYNSQECPSISKIIPEQIQRDKERLLTIYIQHFPDFQIPATYKCVFTSLDNSDRLITVANRTSQNLQCYTPKVSALPPFHKGTDFVVMKLIVQMNNKDLVHESVIFFDCGIHKSCTTCTMSNFSCTWCIRKHMCTENTDQYCNTDVLITGINKSGISTTPGPDHCPKIEPYLSANEILVAAGSRKSIEVKALSLQNFQLDNIRCQFNAHKEVPATVNRLSNQDYLVTCAEHKFEYNRDVDFQNVHLKVLWGGGDSPLDNPSGILVVMYKCSNMAFTCGVCLTIDPKFGCGWCNDASCVASSTCRGTDFLQIGAVCPNPRISNFFPKSGPTNGGTLITLSGTNLGSSVDEVQVSIDLVKCNVTEFKAHERITCKTEHSNFVLSDKIKVIIGHGKQVMTESNEQFHFVKPSITSVSPMVGPFAGGTSIIISGEHLDAGSNMSVLIGHRYSCVDLRRLNDTAISCQTSETSQPESQSLEVTMHIDDDVLRSPGVVFTYVPNPNVTWVSRNMIIRSGGLLINVSGENLHNVQSPQIVIWLNGRGYYGSCKLITSTNMTCFSPTIPDFQELESSQDLDFGFKMDGVQHLQQLKVLGKMKVSPDPVLEKYKDGEKVHQQSQEILFINGHNLAHLKLYDVQVHIGKEECVVNSVVSTVIACKPPVSQPAAIVGDGIPEVIVKVGTNLTYTVGSLRYEKQEELSLVAIIGIAVGAAVFIVVTLIVCVICCIKSRRNDDMMKKLRKDMDQLESRVANECKEAFAELQTDMTELTSNLSGGTSIPFWDYRTYCMRVLFPPECNDHPVLRDLELDFRHRDDTERGLKLFFNLMRNKTFLLIFIRTLEADKDFSMKERVNVASLISVSLQTQMEYATEILKTLLAELIEKTIDNSKVNPKILLRRNESVAEKMLANWFTFLLYKYFKECAGEPLFMLYGAIKQQVSKGPVDAITSEARYSLSEDKLIRQHINYKPLVLNVMDVDVDRCSQSSHPVKVLDCDTISQVKEKILDAMYKSAPFSSRPAKEELDLVFFDHPSECLMADKSQMQMKTFPNNEANWLVLSDEDNTSRSEGDCRPLNTLSHYKVSEGAYVALHRKQTSRYNNCVPDRTKYNDHVNYNRTPLISKGSNPQSINIDVDGCKVYHLVRHQDIESSNKEGDRGNKMMTEIYLPRLLVTKGTLQSFVDELFERIFSTAHRGTALPLAIKYMFDFLDDQALHHNMDDEVVHIWKSNSLPLRFWVNVIKNPNFAFDIYKSNIVDACLTVIGQTFMDSCSTLENKLTKDSPSGKLLYAKEIPKYKQWVSRYYQDIKIMPAISDQDMTAMLAEESRTHQNEFNTNAALLELYKYVRKHYEDIMNALEDDEFAKKNRLTYKLDQVASAMDGSAIC